MNGEKNKVIILIDYPFNKRDYDRFGIEILRKNGLDVEIWDITPCIHKKFKDQLIEEKNERFKGLIIFNENSDIVKAISGLYKGSIINCFIEYSIHTFFIFRAITMYSIDYCVFGMASFPSPYPIQTSSFDRIISILKRAEALKIREIVEHVLNKLILKYFFIFRIAPASIILLSGEMSEGSSSYPVDRTTTRLWAHSLDYDIYLQHEHLPNSPSKKMGVFLDQYFPFHPEFFYVGLEFPLSPDNYYPKICNFFKILEKKTHSEIIIAAHPRSDYNKLPDYFNNRTRIKGETASIVKESSFVITHTSTAINFAVLYHKPIIFITTDELQKMVSGKNLTGLYITAIAAELGKKPINIDRISEVNWDEEMDIDEDAYLRFRTRYIKKQGTPEKPLWEIFCSHIQ